MTDSMLLKHVSRIIGNLIWPIAILLCSRSYQWYVLFHLYGCLGAFYFLLTNLTPKNYLLARRNRCDLMTRVNQHRFYIFVHIPFKMLTPSSLPNFLDDETNVLAPLDDDKSDVEKNDNNIDDAVDEDVVEPNDEEDADELDAFGDDDDVEEELAYNSEEEIITKQKATEFFENEAELSESEWGSEDENEQNLDDLEKEAGDDDVLDEDELKKELGKIHM